MPILPFLYDDENNLEKVVKETAKNNGKFVLAAGLTMSDYKPNTFTRFYPSISQN